MSFCPAHGFFIGTSCTLCWLNDPVSICLKHDWNMGTYCAACRDEALEAYRNACIGGYRICNRHGPYSEPTCQKCQSELNKNMSAIVKSIAKQENAMNAPTEEQLRDPEYWDSRYQASVVVIAIERDARGGLEGIYPLSTHSRPIIPSHPDNDVEYYERPKTPTKKERLARHIAERDAFLAEDEAPDAYMCPAGCGCLWRDNGNDTMSLYGPRSQSCDVCEPLPLDRLIPVKKLRTKEQREREETVSAAMAAIKARGVLIHTGHELAMEDLYDAGMLRKVS